MASALKQRLRRLERASAAAIGMPALIFTDDLGEHDAEQAAAVKQARAAGRRVIEITSGHGCFDISGAEPVRMV